VSLDLQPTAAAHIEEPASVVALTLELHLAIAFELLHRFDMAEKNTSLSMEVFDLIEFLVAQVASLSSFLAVEVACEAIIAESSTLPPVACKAMDLQSVIIISLATPPCRVIDSSSGGMQGHGSTVRRHHLVSCPNHTHQDVNALTAGVRSSTPSAVDVELQAPGIRESFKAKPPELVALEVGLKGAALVCSR
jgi:hypothetical protein